MKPNWWINGEYVIIASVEKKYVQQIYKNYDRDGSFSKNPYLTYVTVMYV